MLLLLGKFSPLKRQALGYKYAGKADKYAGYKEPLGPLPVEDWAEGQDEVQEVPSEATVVEVTSPKRTGACVHRECEENPGPKEGPPQLLSLRSHSKSGCGDYFILALLRSANKEHISLHWAFPVLCFFFFRWWEWRQWLGGQHHRPWKEMQSHRLLHWRIHEKHIQLCWAGHYDSGLMGRGQLMSAVTGGWCSDSKGHLELFNYRQPLVTTSAVHSHYCFLLRWSWWLFPFSGHVELVLRILNCLQSLFKAGLLSNTKVTPQSDQILFSRT